MLWYSLEAPHCKKHMLWYSLEARHRGASYEYQQHMFLWRNKNKNSVEGIITPAGAKVTGATIRMWLLNKFISFLAVLSWKTWLKKTRTKCLVGHIYSRPVPFPLMAKSSALTFRIIQPNDNGTLT